MSILPIVTLGDPRLRMRGEPVCRFDKRLHRLLDDMTETMREAPGVGLAAQQVGLALQVCVIEVEGDLHELVNPRIVQLDGEQLDWEGCLSIPGYYAERPRAEHAVVEGLNRRGRAVRVAGTGLLARALQHEFDHLQGELYVDGLPPGTELVPVARLHELRAAEAAGDDEEAADVAERELARPA
jgi:peptide deformylase